MLRLSSICIACVLCSACVMSQTQVDPTVRNKMALCGAGISSSIGASLEAKIADSIKNGGKISATLESELRAAYFKGADTGNQNTVEGYKSYLECVQKITYP